MLGAGSAAFTMAIVQDLILSDALNGCTLRLVDIDESRLEEGRRVAESYNKEVGTSIKIEAYLDRREAFHDAGFIICAELAV